MSLFIVIMIASEGSVGGGMCVFVCGWWWSGGHWVNYNTSSRHPPELVVKMVYEIKDELKKCNDHFCINT